MALPKVLYAVFFKYLPLEASFAVVWGYKSFPAFKGLFQILGRRLSLNPFEDAAEIERVPVAYGIPHFRNIEGGFPQESCRFVYPQPGVVLVDG